MLFVHPLQRLTAMGRLPPFATGSNRPKAAFDPLPSSRKTKTSQSVKASLLRVRIISSTTGFVYFSLGSVSGGSLLRNHSP